MSTAVAAGVALLLGRLADEPHWTLAALRGAVVLGVDGVVFLAMAVVLRLHEVTSVVETISARLAGLAPTGR